MAKKKDTIALSSLTKTDSGYIEIKKKKQLLYHYYGTCDSVINNIRNSASYWQMQGDIDKMVRSRIGYDNQAFKDYNKVSRPTSEILYKNCYSEYQNKQFVLQQKYLLFIDSLYNGKVEKLNWIKSNPKSINQTYIENFINSFNYSDPDFRSLEMIIIYQPDLFLNSIYKLTDTAFFSFTLKLDGFPKDLNLKDAKWALEESKSKDKRKRTIIRKMKNNEG